MTSSSPSAPSVATSGPNSYVQELTRAWLDHLDPRADDAPTLVSTFAGGGGSSLGYSMAGFRELLAIEWDLNKAANFRHNFPGIPLHQGDITEIDPQEAVRVAGVKPGELTLFDGSPPCQGFSTAGRRIMEDPRNELFKAYASFVDAFQPKAFVFENVTGLVKGKMRLVFAEIVNTMKDLGYYVIAQVVDASYLGVPQKRQRLIMHGLRQDLQKAPTAIVATSRPIPSGMAIEGADTSIPDVGLSELNDQLWHHVAPGKNESHVRPKRTHYNNNVKLDPAKPSQTLLKMTTMRGFASFVHHREKRVLSIGEAKRLSSFPDEYTVLPDPQVDQAQYSEAWAVLGDCVPPFMARAIGRHIREELGV